MSVFFIKQILDSEVDGLIASIKTATVKNKTRRDMFLAKNIPVPPSPIVTRWGSWLAAVFYYSKHFNAVKEIFDSITTEGKLVQSAKKSLGNPKVFESLTTVCNQYSELLNIFDSVDVTFTVEKAARAINELCFGNDCCNIKDYLGKRMEKNGLSAIIRKENPNLNPVESTRT